MARGTFRDSYLLGKNIDISELTLESFSEVMLNLNNESSVMFWEILQSFGYDLWLNLSGLNTYEEDPYQIKLSFEQLIEIMNWVNVELCQETKHVLTYPANNIRVTIHAHELNPENFAINVNFVDDSFFEDKFSLLKDLSLRELRIGWSLIKELNKYLSDTLNFVKISPMSSRNSNCKWLSVGTALSTMRNLIMSPIKSELMAIVL